MEKKKIWIIYLTQLFTFFGLSDEEQVKMQTNRIKLRTNNLSYEIVLEKEKKLKNNFITEHEKKKLENFKISNSQKEKYNKKINSLENNDKEESYLFKNTSFINLKNYNVIMEPSSSVYIRKKNPYLYKINNTIEDKIKEELNSITNSFIQNKILLSTDSKLLGEYKNLISLINEGIDKAKTHFITALAHNDVIRLYIKRLDKRSQTFYSNETQKNFQQFYNCSENSLAFHNEAKNDMIKRFYYLLSLEKNPEKDELYTKELDIFKEKIENNKKSIKNYEEECSRRMNSSFNNLNTNLYYEFCSPFSCSYQSCSNPCCKNQCCNLINCMYEEKFTGYISLAKTKIDRDKDNEFIQEIDNFVNSDEMQEINLSFHKRIFKNALNLLAETVIDIKNDYKKQSDIAHYSFNQLIELQKNYLKVSFNIMNLAEGFLRASSEFKKAYHYSEWNEQLREKFNEFKVQFYILFYII